MSKHSYIIDTTSNRLLESFTSTRAAKPDSLVFGDAAQVSVQLVEPNSNNAEWPWQYVDLTGQTIRVGVGSLSDATPSAYIELTDDMATPSATVTVIREGVLNTTNELVRVQINDAYAGNYTLTVAGETTNPICLSGPLDTIADEIEGLASITADSVWITGTATDFNIEFDSSLDDIGAITVAVDALRGYEGKTGTLDLHVEEISALLDGGTEIEATLEVVRWTTADVAGETVLQAPVMVRQDVIPDTVPGTTPLPGYPVDLDQITQSGAATGQVPSWNGSEWVPITASGTGDALVANGLDQFAATTSAELAGVLSDETGTGAAVFATSPTLVTPDLGTPSAIDLTNATNMPAGAVAAADITDATADGIALMTSADANAFTDADESKLDGIEAAADVTDTANVTSAGALMDSEVINLAQVKAFDATDYATATQGATADSALQSGDIDTLAELDAIVADVSLDEMTQLGFACSDETSPLTTGQKIAIDVPYSMIVRRVYASLVTAGTVSSITLDIEDEGSSILNAVLTLTAGSTNAETSTFAAAASSYTLTKGDLLTIDIDSVDSGGTGAGLKVILIGNIS